MYFYIYTIASDYTIAATQLVVADNIDGTFSWVGTVHQSGLTNNQFRDTQFFKDTNPSIIASFSQLNMIVIIYVKILYCSI